MQKTEHAVLCSTKASRDKLAAQIIALAEKCGADATQAPALFSDRGTDISLAKGPWRCSISLEGGSNVGAFLGHWHHRGDGQETLPDCFAYAIHGTVNEYHRRKATSCDAHFPLFLMSIERGLLALMP